tara:strand:+ start:4510 stop:5697 length:1188 start_codon:yes stop_codon:yes gene_type:complete
MIFLYIDPGTGSLIITSLVALFISLKNFLLNVYYKLISFFSTKKNKLKNDFSGKLVFFSEGKKYWLVFKPVLDNLNKKKIPFIYLTADSSDPGLKLNSSYYLGNMNSAIHFLNNLKAKVLVCTTPQLDILQWKRSKNVKHYCYINHSPVDIHSYKKFAFDHFDSILCTSSFQIKNLNYLEKSRGSKCKVLLETGCTYYDEIFEKKINNRYNEFILIAPTWGDRSFLLKYGYSIIKTLINNNYKIIFRPHPQSWISDLDSLNIIIKKFKNYKNFLVDKEINSEESTSKSKVLITDISSGIVHDIIFLNNLPVLAIDFSWDDGGYESSSLNSKSSSSYLINDFGKILKEEDLESIVEIIEKSKSFIINEKTINKHVFNFKNSGYIASNQIMKIYNSI